MGPYQAYKPEYNETYYYFTPPPWYKPDKYYKPTEPPNAEPAPMPDPLKPYEKKLYYKDYTSTTWKPEPYKEPKFEKIPDLPKLPKYYPPYYKAKHNPNNDNYYHNDIHDHNLYHYN